jgi:hypothetical protein
MAAGRAARPERARAALAATSIQTVTALGAVAVVAIGAIPMAAASVNRTADPILAQEFKSAGTLLGAQASQVELVAIAANPTYYSAQFTQAFTRQEGLADVPDWLYLTGTLAPLQRTWAQYGIEVQNLPAGAMSAHNDLAFVIDRGGRIRQEVSDDPGPGTVSTKSSFAALLAADARQALSQP